MISKLLKKIKAWWDSLKQDPFLDGPDVKTYNITQLFKNKD